MIEPSQSAAPDAAALERPWQRRLLAALATVALFAVAGPIAGYFVVFIALSIASAPDAALLLRAVGGSIALLPVGVPFAFVFGWWPALLTGLAMASIDALGDLGEYRVPIAIVLGAVITGLLLGRTVWGEPGLESSGVLTWIAAAGATGGLAAAMCAALPLGRARGP